MTEAIRAALKDCGIDEWIIRCSRTESAELFLIRREEDQRREKNVTTAAVTVYHDTVTDGIRKRGSADVVLSPDMTEADLRAKLSRAYANAVYAANPFYELPEAAVEDTAEENGPDLMQTAQAVRDALYAPDTDSAAFINSAEIFVEKTRRTTLTSRGTSVRYTTFAVSGELVVQCEKPHDVEIIVPFRYRSADTVAIKELAADALRSVRDRAEAQKPPLAGEYDVILTDDRVRSLVSAYTQRACASLVYPGYSRYKPGFRVQSEDCEGERLRLSLFSDEPFSADGIPMPERTVIENGTVTQLWGGTRFCRYLGIEPTGDYRGIRCLNGSLPLEQMKRGRVLMPVVFSDFQCDSLSGFFGGEIRLAYLFEGGTVTLLTGGSISGDLTAKQDKLRFSLERRVCADWDGPKAVLIPGVSVAGE